MTLEGLLTDLDGISARMESFYGITDAFLAQQLDLLVTQENGTTYTYDKAQQAAGYARVSEECKAGHVLLSRFGKNFEKVKGDPLLMGESGRNGLFGGMGATDSKDNAHRTTAATINLCILQHFYRTGLIEIADDLAKDLTAQMRAPFVEMHGLLGSLDQAPCPNPQPTIDWVSKNAELLGSQGRRLLFQIHAAHYQDLLSDQQHRISDALAYAQKHFAPFTQDYLSDIQMLLGSLVFAHRTPEQPSPYAQVFRGQSLWADVRRDLVTAYCRIHQMSRESSLEICVNVGTLALPKISQVISLMKGRRGVEWSLDDQLPLEVEVPRQHRYHSVFICPVLRQQSGPENPPMMMPCGHVICKEALTRLSKGNGNFKFKCPYCPQESFATQAIKVEF